MEKDTILKLSKKFWEAMEHADGESMREVADENCTFVHIGVTCGLEQEISYYTDKIFRPTELVFNSQKADIFGDTGVVITDCNYGLLLDGKPTTHHFAVTEVYSKMDDGWKLVTFSFTALVY